MTPNCVCHTYAISFICVQTQKKKKNKESLPLTLEAVKFDHVTVSVGTLFAPLLTGAHEQKVRTSHKHTRQHIGRWLQVNSNLRLSPRDSLNENII